MVYSMKCQKNVENAHLSFAELSVTSSDCFFCPNNSPEHKDSSFILINDTDKQQILTFKRLNQQFLFTFLFGKWLKWLIDCKIMVGDKFYCYLIIAASSNRQTHKLVHLYRPFPRHFHGSFSDAVVLVPTEESYLFSQFSSLKLQSAQLFFLIRWNKIRLTSTLPHTHQLWLFKYMKILVYD